MKRSILGLGMLLILLAVAIFTTGYMQKCHEEVLLALHDAEARAEKGDWQQARAGVAAAKAGWEAKWGITAALCDHEPMETVNDLLAQLEVYTEVKDPVQFAAVCARLREALEAIGEAHSVAWWNLA